MPHDTLMLSSPEQWLARLREPLLPARGLHDPPAGRLVPGKGRGKYMMSLPVPWSPYSNVGCCTVEYLDARRVIRVGDAAPLELEWAEGLEPGVLVLTGDILALAGWYCWMKPGLSDLSPRDGSTSYMFGHSRLAADPFLVVWCGQCGLFPGTSQVPYGSGLRELFPLPGDSTYLTGDRDGFGWSNGSVTAFSHEPLRDAEVMADRCDAVYPQPRAGMIECPVMPESCRAMRWCERVAARFWATQIQEGPWEG